MQRRAQPNLKMTMVAREAVSGLAALAFGQASVLGGDAKHLAFLPLESLELDLDDPEQCDFGDYELREQLGQGGMGVVYRAWQRSLQREVALKLLSAGPWASPEFVTRFRREAQSAARLQHPNIVPIHEIGQHAELNFFSMGLVRGQSLEQQLDQHGPMPPRDAARLVRTVAEALDYAHRLGILHLDLKPANVLLDEHGEPQVADFGLARRLDETLASDGSEVSGTPSYMAPEQAQAKNRRIGVATDIYGLGAILYELLGGRPPFLGATPRQTLEQVVGEDVASLHRRDRTIPEDLDAICLKCLAKDPDRRYVTARGLAEDLGRYLEGRAVSVRPLDAWQRLRRWIRREPRVALASGLALTMLVAGLIATSIQWQRADTNAEAARANLWLTRAQAGETALAAGDAFVGLRPLVRNLAEMEAAGRDADAALERQRIGTALANAPQLLDLIPLADLQSVAALAIAPDGRSFAIASHANGRWVRQFELPSGRELWATSTLGLTHVLPFAHDIPHDDLRYTPDGRHLLVQLMQQPPFAAPTRTDAIALDTRDGHVLTPPDQGQPHADVVYSDDARIALVRYRSEPSLRFPDSGQFFETDGWRPLGPHRALDAELASDFWLPTPDGSAWLGSSDFRHFTLFDPATLKPRWRLVLPEGELARAWRFDTDADLLALGTTSGAVHLVDSANGHRVGLPSAPSTTVRWLEFSADAATLAAWAEDGSIVIWDVASRRPRAAALSGPGGIEPGRLRLAADRLYSVQGNQLRSWSLAPAAPFDNLAVPASARLRNAKGFHRHAFDVHPASGLLITGGMDGRIGFWRLPLSTVLEARAAPLPPHRQFFDGRQIVAVDRNVVQLRDVASGAPLSGQFRHSEPVRFAELSFDGRHLVTIAGRTLRVIDPASGVLRGDAIVLAQTPLRVDLARAAPVLALTIGEYLDGVLHERIEVVDLDSGRLRARMPAVPGRLREFELDPLGRYVLIEGLDGAMIRSGALRRVELAADAPVCSGSFTDAESEQVRVHAIAISDDGRSAWSASDLPGRRRVLQRWDMDTCRVLVRHELPSSGWAGITLQPLGEDVMANRFTADALGLFAADGSRGAVARVLPAHAIGEFALSRDGRRIAVATRSAVMLIDRLRGERLSAPLQAPIAGNDGIAKLAFSPDAARLLARTVGGHWLVWNLPVAGQSARALGTLAAVLDPEAGDAVLDAHAIGDLRQHLHATDAGSAQASAVAAMPDIDLAPASGSGPDPRYLPLDLGTAINVPLNGPWPRMPAMSGDLPTLAPGMQRLLGVDYRVEGGVQLSWGGAAVALHPTQRRSEVVPLPGVHAARVHVLMFMHIPMSPTQPAHHTASVLLDGEDGRETVLEIHTRRDVVNHNNPGLAEPGARIGWSGIGRSPVRAGDATSSSTWSSVYAVTLDIPPGTGALRGLRFQTGDGPMEAPLFYAATLELSGTVPPPTGGGP